MAVHIVSMTMDGHTNMKLINSVRLELAISKEVYPQKIKFSMFLVPCELPVQTPSLFCAHRFRAKLTCTQRLCGNNLILRSSDHLQPIY